jgi:site-specific recombinase XerD
MDRVERRKLGERLPRPMNREQVKAFFEQIDQLRDKALFSLLYGSGLRVSEALGLDIEEISLEEREFRVVGKGDRERVGYLAEDTVKLLRRYLRERGRPRQGPLFWSRHRTRLSYSMAWRLFRRYADGLEETGQPLTIHQLRHTFGSDRAGQMDALILRDLMGHKSLQTTLQYAQVNGESVKKAFRAFDRQRGRK